MTHDQRRDRREKIARFVQLGKDPVKVAEKFGVSHSLVMLSCAEHDVEWPEPERSSNGSCYAILAELLNTRASQQRIATDHGVTRQRVHQVYREAVEAGIEFDGRKDTQ